MESSGGDPTMQLSRRQRDYLDRMGITVWEARLPAPFACPETASGEPVNESKGLELSGRAVDAKENGEHAWEVLASAVSGCTACPLHEGRTQTVFGTGNKLADWMFIGEAPGEQEDLRGEPFVGRAGQLLNEMIRAIGLSREQVYIANVLKCRPPKNRDPLPAEAAACEGFLKQQVRLVRPDIIVAVGRVAAQNLLRTGIPIGKLRGSVHEYQSIPLVVTYHPAYLLRSQAEKRRAWEDLKLALRTLRRVAESQN